ncbi:MAG: PD-(D/E)XK nuclease family protein [Myxococcota bacterium]
MSTLYSHSRLSSFEQCKQKFQFRYLLEIPEETEGVEAFVGKRVHEILERLYQFVGREELPSLRRVLERYHAEFDEHYDPDRIRIVRTELDVAHYRELGVRCLSDFYRNRYPFDQDETLGLEYHVLIDLGGDGRHRVQGFIDRVSRTPDGTIEIQDYKTGKWVPSRKQLDLDRQLALYQLGLMADFGAEQPMRLVWLYLARGRTLTSTRTPEQLEQLRRETIVLIDHVEATREFPTRKSNLCNWCEYKGICPAFGGEPPRTRPSAVASRAPASSDAPVPPSD